MNIILKDPNIRGYDVFYPLQKSIKHGFVFDDKKTALKQVIERINKNSSHNLNLNLPLLIKLWPFAHMPTI